tara:strand:+ start:483 stop:704 length:222 start_codon:yes stop_codon:yes gene_type:complete
MSKLLEEIVMYTLEDSLKFKGLPMRSKPLSFQLQSEIEALPFEHQEVLMDFISRVRELEYEVDSIYEKLSSIG